MKKIEYATKGFVHAFGVFVYVSAVAWLMTNAKSVFGGQHGFFIPVFVLLLFIISATVTGLLVLGKPIHLYLRGLKKEALVLLFATLAWLLAFLILVGGILLFL